jgi:septum formation protein
MLEPIRHILLKQRNILASGSPRRREILNSIGLPHEVIPSNFIEDLDKESFSHPCEYVKENAKQKAMEVWKRLAASGDPETRADLVIGADTVVTMDETIYEKPKDKEDAFNILSKLSGQKHTVFTGVALITRSPASGNAGVGGGTISEQTEPGSDFVVTTFHEATDVMMTQMSASLIRAYVESGEPMDKAGAYAIQGAGGTLVEGIKGDFYNVVGIPLHRLVKELYYMYND